MASRSENKNVGHLATKNAAIFVCLCSPKPKMIRHIYISLDQISPKVSVIHAARVPSINF